VPESDSDVAGVALRYGDRVFSLFSHVSVALLPDLRQGNTAVRDLLVQHQGVSR